MTGRLTTHVLDTANGRPAAGMGVELHRWEDGRWHPVATITLDADGRAAGPLLEGEALLQGDYRITFRVGDYFTGLGSADAKTFLNRVPVDFSVADASAHYHVPLLCSPWAYSTYRGS